MSNSVRTKSYIRTRSDTAPYTKDKSAREAFHRKTRAVSPESTLKECLKKSEDSETGSSAKVYYESKSLDDLALRAEIVHPIRDTLMGQCLSEDREGFFRTILKAIGDGIVPSFREYRHFQKGMFERDIAYMMPFQIWTELRPIQDEAANIIKFMGSPSTYIKKSIDQFRNTGNFSIRFSSNRDLLVCIQSYLLMQRAILSSAVIDQTSAPLLVPNNKHVENPQQGDFSRYDLSPQQLKQALETVGGLCNMFQELLNKNIDKAEALATTHASGVPELLSAITPLPVSREEAFQIVKEKLLASPKAFSMSSLSDALDDALGETSQPSM